MSVVNPFSRFLRQWNQDGQFDEFLEHWDVLESLLVTAYRSQTPSAKLLASIETEGQWLRNAYVNWEDVLRPLLSRNDGRIAGGSGDPIQAILAAAAETKEKSVDWQTIRQLANVREGLNRYLMADHETHSKQYSGSVRTGTRNEGPQT